MTIKQALRDRVRYLNRSFTNKILIRICGRKIGHFSILAHTGRKTGKLYRIPVIAEPVEGGFVIALTYGRKVDWAANVLARDGAGLVWKNSEYRLVRPEYIAREAGLKAFPALLRPVLRAVGIEDFMKLSIQKE